MGVPRILLILGTRGPQKDSAKGIWEIWNTQSPSNCKPDETPMLRWDNESYCVSILTVFKIKVNVL